MKRVGDLTIPQVAALYARVPADRLEEFQAFRRAFPYQDTAHGGVTWPYMTGGQGEPPLLLLSGALAIPDISWTSITNFAARRRVIVPAYPPVRSMDGLVDGIAAVLQHEGVDGVHVMGGSYGGFVAQIFVRRHPHLARSLVLSHTLPPYPEIAARIRLFARLLRWMPRALVRPLMRQVFRPMMPEWSEETACFLAIFDELVGHTLDKADVLGILERTIDYSVRSFVPEDLSKWPGKVLLVFGADDASTPPEVRQRLASLYPGCQVHVFEGAGHATSVTHQDEYVAAIEDFLSER